jgi:hypothetical protein
VRAEKLFRIKGDRGQALYAHVSQIAVRMESSDLSLLIAELSQDLLLPEAKAAAVRLRILEMKAKCEQEYDAGMAKKSFAEVEQLALKQHKCIWLRERVASKAYLPSRWAIWTKLRPELGEPMPWRNIWAIRLRTSGTRR